MMGSDQPHHLSACWLLTHEDWAVIATLLLKGPNTPIFELLFWSQLHPLHSCDAMASVVAPTRCHEGHIFTMMTHTLTDRQHGCVQKGGLGCNYHLWNLIGQLKCHPIILKYGWLSAQLEDLCSVRVFAWALFSFNLFFNVLAGRIYLWGLEFRMYTCYYILFGPHSFVFWLGLSIFEMHLMWVALDKSII